MNKTAIVIGVGPVNGPGDQLCLRFARMGLLVLVAGRTQASLDNIVSSTFTSNLDALGRSK